MKLLDQDHRPDRGAVVLLVLVAVVLVVFCPAAATKTLTADFPRTVSLYEGSDVKILGVPVGKVDKVTPTGTKVRVKMHYDDKYKVPGGRQGGRRLALDRRRPVRAAHPGLQRRRR